MVTVIIPCYNVSEYIGECLESVYNQSYKYLEVICVDNNSTDDTFTKLNELKEVYPDLIVVSENKRGAPSARNKGLMIANGEWIQFLDADDLLLPTKIESQINRVNSSSYIPDFISGAYISKLYESIEVKHFPIQNMYIAPFINMAGNTCSNLWRKSALLDIGNWNEDLLSSQETELMFRLILSQKKYNIDKSLLTIIRERRHGQISQRNPVDRLKQYIDVRLSYINKLILNYPGVYYEIKSKLYDFLTVTIIELSQYNKQLAFEYYNTYVKNEWDQTSNSFGMNQLKHWLIKSLGIRFYFFITSFGKR